MFEYGGGGAGYVAVICLEYGDQRRQRSSNSVPGEYSGVTHKIVPSGSTNRRGRRASSWVHQFQVGGIPTMIQPESEEAKRSLEWVRPLFDITREQWKSRIDSACSRTDPNGLRLRLRLSNSESRRLLFPSNASRNPINVA